MRTKIFFDTEFTGLRQSTTLISLALCADDGREFYAEFSDFDQNQCDDWIKENVLSLTRWTLDQDTEPFERDEERVRLCYGDSDMIRLALLNWLSVYDDVEIWADCLAWDWVLFCELFGGAFELPKQVFYMPFDLVTLFRCKNLDADTSRLEFAKKHQAHLGDEQPHNALFDARLTKVCHDLLQKI